MTGTPTTLNASNGVLAGAAPKRLLSLDAFRGFVILVMFLVNVGGTDAAFTLGNWAPEQYRRWMPHMGWSGGRMGNGLADYVFPWFLFIVGVAIPFSMASGRGRDKPALLRVAQAFRRGVVIYLLGTLLWMASIGYAPAAGDSNAKWNGPITMSVLLHWDILPLIGFGYVLATVLALTPRWAQLAFVALVLVGKWALLKIGLPEGTTDFRHAIDAKQTLQQTLGTRLGLPGWWSTLITQGLAFGSLVVLGSLAGTVLRDESLGSQRRARALLVWGGSLSIAALGWWLIGDLPFSKDLVSPTYILITAGTAGLLLAGMYWLVDIRSWTSLTFLRVLGVNALFAYLLAELVWKMALVRWRVALPPGFGEPDAVAITAWKAWLQHFTTPMLGTYLTVALYIAAIWLVCRAMYTRRWFVKV